MSQVVPSASVCPHCGADPTDEAHRGDREICPHTFGRMSDEGLIGTLVDRYRVLRWLGGGGFGAVYEAEHSVVGRRVALKILYRDRRCSPTSVERFFGEARAAAAIGSPHIIDVFDGGTDKDGNHFLAIELVDGCSLHQLLEAQPILTVSRAFKIIDQVLVALTAAHEAGIVHRDIKPANIMLEGTSADGSRSDDMVRLVDFGISKIPREAGATLTRTGDGMGTPGYGSPEQFLSAGQVDARSDVYSAAAVLFHMLAGELPHGDSCSYEEFVVRVCTQPARALSMLRPDLLDSLGAVLARGLEIDIHERIGSAAAMREGLAVALDGFEEEATAATAIQRAPPRAPVAPTKSLSRAGAATQSTGPSARTVALPGAEPLATDSSVTAASATETGASAGAGRSWRGLAAGAVLAVIGSVAGAVTISSLAPAPRDRDAAPEVAEEAPERSSEDEPPAPAGPSGEPEVTEPAAAPDESEPTPRTPTGSRRAHRPSRASERVEPQTDPPDEADPEGASGEPGAGPPTEPRVLVPFDP